MKMLNLSYTLMNGGYQEITTMEKDNFVYDINHEKLKSIYQKNII